MTEPAKGLLAMLVACVIWGLSPILYKALANVPAEQVLAHRTIWSLLFFLVILSAQRRLGVLAQALTSRTSLPLICVAAAMITVNWGLFIWAIQSGFGVEASLGYYIFPLMSVCVGTLVFKDRLTPAQWAAVLLAVGAVVTLTLGLGAAPWIAISLATTFTIYSALKKFLTIGPMVSVAAEVSVLAGFALAYLVWIGWGDFGQNGMDMALLLLSGPITGLPLMLMSYATKRASLSNVGLVGYVNPTLQFFCAVVLFSEPFTGWHQLAFGLIWLALAIYSFAGLRDARPPVSAQRPPAP